MFFITDKIVAGMAGIRILSATIEFTAAMLMLKFGRVETAFKINSLLALVGPTVFLIVTTLGLVGWPVRFPSAVCYPLFWELP